MTRKEGGNIPLPSMGCDLEDPGDFSGGPGWRVLWALKFWLEGTPCTCHLPPARLALNMWPWREGWVRAGFSNNSVSPPFPTFS